MKSNQYWAAAGKALAVVLVMLIAISLSAVGAGAQTYKVLYRFRGGSMDGASSYAGLVFDAVGNLYGVTMYGGNKQCNDGIGVGCGTVFKLAPNPGGSWTESVIYSFKGGTDGSNPFAAALILDTAGNLYGTTFYGGAYNYGTVFKLAPNPDSSWTESVLYTFKGGVDGISPHGGLIMDATGSLYGTTVVGGDAGRCYSDNGCGTVFKLTPNPNGNWTESVLYRFTGGADGGDVYEGVTMDAAGNLYGTTFWWGGRGLGVAYKLTPNPDGTWTQSIMHTFTGGKDGENPYARLILDAAGNVYGTTISVLSTAFKLTPQPDGSWQWSKLHNLRCEGGCGPYGDLIFDAAGNLYNTEAFGGLYAFGTVTKLTPQPDGTWTKSKYHTFKGSRNGGYPYGGVIRDAWGNLYGTTNIGGRMDRCGGQGCGVIFEITP